MGRNVEPNGDDNGEELFEKCRSRELSEDPSLSTWPGSGPGLTCGPPSPELLLLLPGLIFVRLIGFEAFSVPSRLMITSELSIRSMLCPESILPNRSGTGAASTTELECEMPTGLRERPTGRATG